MIVHKENSVFLTLSIDIGSLDEDNVITMMTITMMMIVLITGMLVRHRLLTKIGGAAAQLCIGRWYKQATTCNKYYNFYARGCFFNVPSTKMLETLESRA